MKNAPIIIFLSFVLSSLNISASEIYQCKSPEGNTFFFDKPCAKGNLQEKIDFKDLLWTKALDANKPVVRKSWKLQKRMETQ